MKVLLLRVYVMEKLAERIRILKQKLLSGLVMSREQPHNAMVSCGQQLLLKGHILSDEALLQGIRSVTLPQAKEIANILKSLDAPTLPEEVGVCREYVSDGILYAKELRDRYTILQLLWDIDCLSQMKDSVIQ